MARQTTSNMEVRQLSRVAHRIPHFGILQLSLYDGSVVEGIIRSQNIGSRSGKGVACTYCAALTLETIHGQYVTVDYLDILTFQDVYVQRCHEYESKGLLRIGEYPIENI
jgi:hypothetical protein